MSGSGSEARLRDPRETNAVNPGSRILVIDDSQTVIRAVQQAFADTSCCVETVAHYLEIPRYLRTTPPDLVVLDLKMPGISGERISEFIRRDQQRDTPIVIYSSLPEETLEAAASRIGADGWVSKQTSLERLVALVKATLAGHRGGGRW
jgi:DNA-binding response OmpR family regulator